MISAVDQLILIMRLRCCQIGDFESLSSRAPKALLLPTVCGTVGVTVCRCTHPDPEPGSITARYSILWMAGNGLTLVWIRELAQDGKTRHCSRLGTGPCISVSSRSGQPVLGQPAGAIGGFQDPATQGRTHERRSAVQHDLAFQGVSSENLLWVMGATPLHTPNYEEPGVSPLSASMSSSAVATMSASSMSSPPSWVP